ncbi:MAG: hypothetical protein EHM64_05815 [Ignavibacteriae bacterium]|nr:MAG: hypothetical protein EHM64_05815 [Ignavibacteriota bacterium]
MTDSRVHSFHIPVLGLAFSVDTPLRVARFGISSVISIVDDILIEHMRKHYARVYGVAYNPITVRDEDYRAKRITAYLNLLHHIVQKQIADLKASAFEKGSEIVKYFEMLPEDSPIKSLYHCMVHATTQEKQSELQQELRSNIVAGDIDVNIMTKLDKVNFGRDEEKLPAEYSDAIASLRGFAESDVSASVILSAGLNSRLFSYLGQRKEFIPDEQGRFKKRVILKVTDFRSAFIQGKILAKKGIWISEFRIESGLNCGGHAFASDGYLLGPILEEFKTNRENLYQELSDLYKTALEEKSLPLPSVPLHFRISVQGGIGTAKEDQFLRKYYHVDGTGWGSPFLLVPEATNIDDATRDLLAHATREDFYISDASPLGVPFNNVHGSTSDLQIRKRFNDGKPGSRCTKKFLVSNTEFTTEPICTASSQYQELKIEQLKKQNLPPDVLEQKIAKVVAKACLCEDLAASGLINSNGHGPVKERAVAVCPGPNLAYFSKIASLEEMVGHIYGRIQLMTDPDRPNLFINELRLYVDYMKDEIQKRLETWNVKEQKYFNTFKMNLQDGINHYKSLIPNLLEESDRYRETMRKELLELERELTEIMIPAIALS